uniref:Uncharacterized protein n=1 Tax=uncultured bacterium A1Q1_fos_600 TaxID=1256587 RepID=L7VUK2_9BACT|nr:hypothetical protein [uncultured bacterium A1Q1_fos_600]
MVLENIACAWASPGSTKSCLALLVAMNRLGIDGIRGPP